MQELPVTRVSLIVRLQDGSDGEAWQEFIRLYAPVVYGFARKRGLQDADAADLMQEVLRSVAAAAGRQDYDPQRGSFRGWLYTVTRNRINNFLSARRREVAGGDTAAYDRLRDHPGPEVDHAGEWERDVERRLAAVAMERVRGEFREATWQAFWLTAVEGKSAREAGDAVKLSPGAVYVARSRVVARLREEIQRLQEE